MSTGAAKSKVIWWRVAWECELPFSSRCFAARFRDWLGILYKVSKNCFSKRLSLHYLQCCHFGVWSMFGSKCYGSVSHNPVITQSSSYKAWRLKPLFWRKSLGRNDVTKTRPGFWALFKMAAKMFEFWLLWRGISQGKPTLYRLKHRWVQLFLSFDKIYAFFFFGMTFSLNISKHLSDSSPVVFM